MQLTKLDHWLREKYIYRTHIYAMRVPEVGLPGGVLVEELEDTPSRKYRYRFIADAKADVEAVLLALREGNQMFATRIVEENPWFKSIIAPTGKSFFFRVMWIGVLAVSVFGVLTTVALILANAELRQELWDAFQLIMNG